MINIHSYCVPDGEWFSHVTRGVRNSWESWEKGDSLLYYDPNPYSAVFELGENDKALAQKLLNAGKDHGKFIRQIPVLIDFSAPEYFLKEFDTYKIGTTCNRTSMMHTLGKSEFTEDMFSWEDVQQSIVSSTLDNLNYLRDRWLDEGGKRKGPQAEAWRAMVQMVPQSFIYRSTWTGNYQNLRDMYHSRRNHRLKEWREFCTWIEALPYAEEFITNQ